VDVDAERTRLPDNRCTFDPPPVSCCHRLRRLDPITI
jgi:hypothetical protein